MRFSDLGLSEPILRAVEREGYTTATPIQAQAIPHVLTGRDLLGCAQTGTGKTAAFALPLLQRLAAAPRPAGRPLPRCLVLCPTRELAAQIGDSFSAYGRNLGLRHVVIFGGVGQNPQVQALRQGVDIVVATPGRLLDLMQQGHVHLGAIQALVLDEADRMLDMGFIPDVRRIVAKVPGQRQTLLFSATMPGEIRQLADSLLRQPVSVQVSPAKATADGIDQCVYHVPRAYKPALLAHLLQNTSISRALVFTRTKHGADRVVRQLYVAGVRAEAIHGNKAQNARIRALENFRTGKTPVLVATDIASRGIDVDGISHVVNFDLTHEPESYVHRIGRTARAGATGVAISFCDPEEAAYLRAIERLIRRPIAIKPTPDSLRSAATLARAPQSHYPTRPPHPGQGHRAAPEHFGGQAPHAGYPQRGSKGHPAAPPRHPSGHPVAHPLHAPRGGHPASAPRTGQGSLPTHGHPSTPHAHPPRQGQPATGQRPAHPAGAQRPQHGAGHGPAAGKSSWSGKGAGRHGQRRGKRF